MSGFDTRANPDSSARPVVPKLFRSITLNRKDVTPYKVVIPFFVYVNGPSKKNDNTIHTMIFNALQKTS